jgi:hypothetical protein
MPAIFQVAWRQIRCRLLSAFAAPVSWSFFRNPEFRGWCYPKNALNKAGLTRQFSTRTITQAYKTETTSTE